MTTARHKAPAKDAEEQQDPLIFHGPPGHLRADVTVANTGDRRLVVRGLTVHRDGAADVEVPTAALVLPGTTESMPVMLSMDPATKPGDYPAEVQVADIRRAALLRIEPALAMHIHPQRLLAEPGTHDVSFVAVNDGNVDLPLASVTRSHTSDGSKEPGPDLTLTLSAPVVLTSAGTVTVHARLEVPSSLEPTRRHTASIPVGLVDLEVIILARTAETEATS
ncbi:MAG TPA: hypothetical protein VIJ15_11195 [Dermatophilaceae bacterium]